MPPERSRVDDVWRQYRQSGDPRLRERLILTYAPLVKYAAGRVRSALPAHVEEDDLVSDGLFGLMRAIDRFDLDKGVAFETFALPRIRGSIVDALRERDWVPRAVRSRAREIESAMADLARRLNRPATDREVADALGLSQEEYHEALGDIDRGHVLAFDEVIGGDEDPLTLGDLLADPHADDPTEEMLRSDRAARLRAARARLPEREQLLLSLYYDEGLRLREIGEVLGVTESRVSQMHTRATLRLRGMLSAPPEAA